MNNQTPRIGEVWPGQGGIFAGTLRNPHTEEQYHIILHPEALPESPWGEYGKKIEAADSYWDGAANTDAMRTSGHCTQIIAALDALAGIDGHTDYHIPSQAEQNLICCNLRDKVAPEWHWSSTQYSAIIAWIQRFEDGNQYIITKDLEFAVRAVRRILAI